MSETITMNVEGLAELDEALSNFSEKTAKKALNGALLYGSTPMLKDSIETANQSEKAHILTHNNRRWLVQSGLLKESIRRRRLKKKELKALGVSAGYAITIGKGITQKIYPRYWHFLEFGTSKMPPIPFLRPAFERNKEIFVQRFSQKLAQNIAKAQGENT